MVELEKVILLAEFARDLALDQHNAACDASQQDQIEVFWRLARMTAEIAERLEQIRKELEA